MTYFKASLFLEAGERVRRMCWDTPIYKAPNGRMKFDLKRTLAKELGTTYKPSADDLTAVDWVRA